MLVQGATQEGAQVIEGIHRVTRYNIDRNDLPLAGESFTIELPRVSQVLRSETSENGFSLIVLEAVMDEKEEVRIVVFREDQQFELSDIVNTTNLEPVVIGGVVHHIFVGDSTHDEGPKGEDRPPKYFC